MKKLFTILVTISLFLVVGLTFLSVESASWKNPVFQRYNKNKFTGKVTNFHIIRSIWVPAATYSVRDYDVARGGGWNYTTYDQYTYYRNLKTGIIYGP